MLDKINSDSKFTKFLLDETFVDHFLKNEGFDEYIKELKEKYKDKVKDIEYAILILTLLQEKKKNFQPELKEELWSRIIQKKVRARKIKHFALAASFLLIFGFGSVVFYLSQKEMKPTLDKFIITNNKAVFDQSQLILSEGREIIISDHEQNIEYSVDGTKVFINDSEKVKQETKAESFNQLIVSYGRYKSIVLSDGTKIWLNSGSRLIFPPVFSEMRREVYLQGEAYFEVKSDKNNPFYVKTDQFMVRVLGTKFNVQAEEYGEMFTTLLLEGNVTLSTGRSGTDSETILEPNHLAFLSSQLNDFSVVPVANPEDYITWTKGYLIFKNESIKDVLQKIARYYNVHIEYRTSLKYVRISGKLDLKEDPERVLQGISKLAIAKFKKEESKYIIY